MKGFGKDFFWGAASASYQVEGAAFEDGKGMSVWDMMCRKEGAIYEGQNGDVACDHYHRYREDVALMKEIGLGAYRFSLSWPRILPEGTGSVNPAGLDFYDRLVDELLRHGIRPFATLFHWDYPYALYLRGGWLHPDSPDWFGEYTRVVMERLSDRVTDWMTLNEPQCFIGSGHLSGAHAPGDRLGFKEVLLAGHHTLLAHGQAVRAIRAHARRPAQVGYAPVGVVKVPEDPGRPEDVAAAKTAMFAIEDRNCWNNTWWMDPVFLGRYPEDGLRLFGPAVPKFDDQDMALISDPVDFFGVNIYNGRETRADENGQPKEARRPDGFPFTAFDWPVVPSSLYWGPKWFQERYGKPVIITENGIANTDWVSLDGKVHDPQRIDFLHRYLGALRQAIDEGLDARGYFHWSLTDNFEWARGFSKRFGLVHIDYPTQKRTLKDSASWYRDVAASGGANL